MQSSHRCLEHRSGHVHAQHFFRESAFKYPICEWNAAAGIEMPNMFYETVALNQPIGKWNTAVVMDRTSDVLQACNHNASTEASLVIWDNLDIVLLK